MPTDRNLVKKEVSTYAKTLLEAAKAQDAVFAIGGQLEEMLVTVRGHIELRDALEDATLDGTARSNIAKAVFAGMDTALVSMLGVMVERNDIDLLARVLEAYNMAAEEALGVVVVDVTTVVELDDKLREVIKSKLAAEYGKDIVLQEHIDPSILGGIVLGAHGKRIDASVVSQLEHARVVLSNVNTGGEG